MPLISQNYPRVTLEEPPLQLVVAQLQFPAILGLMEPTFLSPFQEAIRGTYPTLKRVETLEVALGPKGMEARPSQAASWAFEDSTGTWRAIVDANSLSLETRRYAAYEDLRTRFVELLRAFVDRVQPATRTRLGLRYVNQFRAPGATGIGAYRALFRPELFGLGASSDLADDDYYRHALGETRLAYDPSQMVVRYGYVLGRQEDGGTPRDDPHFLLDLDHFDVRLVDRVDVDEIVNQLNAFHDDIYRVFRWALSPAGEAVLGIRESATDV
jgi:uncharacterized protein (TIGR04255 family)